MNHFSNSFYILRACFEQLQVDNYICWLVLDYLSDFVYIMDTCVRLRTGNLKYSLWRHDTMYYTTEVQSFKWPMCIFVCDSQVYIFVLLSILVEISIVLVTFSPLTNDLMNQFNSALVETSFLRGSKSSCKHKTDILSSWVDESVKQ